MPQDYSEEKKPNVKRLLPEGWRNFIVTSCSNEQPSKKGNPQYIIKLEDMLTSYEDTLYAINVKGKRWVLKALCDACEVPKNEEGHFLFEPPEPLPIIGKKIMCLIVHEPNEWINREGETIKGVQHKIVDFKKTLDDTQQKEEPSEWGE